MDRFGVRIVTTCALCLVAVGSALSIFVTAPWQLLLTWGLLIGLGTGSMALAFAATISHRWFIKHRGLAMGVLTAGGATGQLLFLPIVAEVATRTGWRTASLLIAASALVIVPVLLVGAAGLPGNAGWRRWVPTPVGGRRRGCTDDRAAAASRRCAPRPACPRSGRSPARSRSAGRRPTG